MVKKEAEKGISKRLLVLGVLLIVFVVLVGFGFYLATKDRVLVTTQAAIVREGIQEEEVSPVIASDDRADDSNKDVDPPDWAIPLGEETIVGYTYPLGMKGPWEQSVPEDGFLLVALGNGTVDGVKASSDGTQGNVFLLVGSLADGSTPADLNETIVIDDYTLGHVQVTFIYVGNEDPQEAALSAVANMFGAPNCGQEGCLEVTLYSWFLGGDWEKEVFTDPPN
jgi:hypothetical protein